MEGQIFCNHVVWCYCILTVKRRLLGDDVCELFLAFSSLPLHRLYSKEEDDDTEDYYEDHPPVLA